MDTPLPMDWFSAMKWLEHGDHVYRDDWNYQDNTYLTLERFNGHMNLYIHNKYPVSETVGGHAELYRVPYDDLKSEQWRGIHSTEQNISQW